MITLGVMGLMLLRQWRIIREWRSAAFAWRDWAQQWEAHAMLSTATINQIVAHAESDQT